MQYTVFVYSTRINFSKYGLVSNVGAAHASGKLSALIARFAILSSSSYLHGNASCMYDCLSRRINHENVETGNLSELMRNLEKQLILHDSLYWFNEHVWNLKPVSKF